MLTILFVLLLAYLGYTGYKTYKERGTVSPLDLFFEAFVKNLKFWQR